MAGLHALVLGLQLIQQLRPILNLNDVVVEKVRVGGVGIQSADEYVLRDATSCSTETRPFENNHVRDAPVRRRRIRETPRAIKT